MKRITLTVFLALSGICAAGEMIWVDSKSGQPPSDGVISGRYVQKGKPRYDGGCLLRVEFIPRAASGAADSWKTAGIGLMSDDGNGWRLNLVESPSAQGNRHSVEMKPVVNGRWGKIEQVIEQRNPNLNWSYGRPYRLLLGVEPSSRTIMGKVQDGEGNTLASFICKLSAPFPRSYPVILMTGIEGKLVDSEIVP